MVRKLSLHNSEWINGYVVSPAGFWKRYVAYFIDIVLLYVVVEIMSTLYFSFQATSQVGLLKDLLNSMNAASQRGETVDPFVIMKSMEAILLPSLIFSSTAYFILAGIYFSWLESSSHQATLGKRMLNIKVTNHLGEPIKFPQAIARYLAATLSWITLNLGHALAAWTPERRALHDYVAGTRVENVDPNNIAMPIWAWIIIGIHALVFIGTIILLFLVILLYMKMLSSL